MTFFQTLTLRGQTKDFSKKQILLTFIKTYLVFSFLIGVAFFAIGVGAELAGYYFDWMQAIGILVISLFEGLFGGLIVGLVVGLFGGLIVGLVVGLVEGLFGGLFVGLIIDLIIDLVGDLAVGLFGGLFGGLLGGLFGGLFEGLVVGLGLGLVVGLIAWVTKWQTESLRFLVNYSLAFLPVFFITYYRPFYLVPHWIQYFYAKQVRNPFNVFQKSPVYFDQMIRMPLWELDDWLIDLYKKDNQLGLEEIKFIIAERPFQAKLAYKALAQVLASEFDQNQQLNELSTIKQRLEKLPSEEKAFPAGFKDARQNLLRIADLSHDYNLRQTTTGKIKVLDDLIEQLSTFQSVMKLTPAPVGTSFEPLATRWLNWAKAEKSALEQSTVNRSLPNPYISGNPLQKRDVNLFVGRQDIFLAIETHILNTHLRPSLLLYGRRRTGKSSTLLNLPNIRFEPIYIDCQDAKWHESDPMFCYNLAQDIYRSLLKSGTHQGITQPKLESYEKAAFTQLDQFLEAVQALLQQHQKRLLLAFDEYEALGEALTKNYISERVLGKLRNIIQHQHGIVVLVSGSHRFEELTELNWANYLINTHTLELSFLDPDSAHQLLTEPVPNLHYDQGVIDSIIQATHCQPYLLQAVASELINHLNSKNQTSATPNDAETAYTKVLKSASAYFSDMWRNGNTEVEQALMRNLALNQALTLNTESQSALNSLMRKEIVLKTAQGYELAIPLFAQWIINNQS